MGAGNPKLIDHHYRQTCLCEGQIDHHSRLVTRDLEYRDNFRELVCIRLSVKGVWYEW